MENQAYLRNYLIDSLGDLEYVEETSPHHPEENVLTHSLQVFEIARRASDDPELWAAALLHDIGKAIDGKTHAQVGAELLRDLLSPRIVWLVRHHLDLLAHPQKTRQQLRNTAQLADLENLRRWDLQGRKPNAEVPPLAQAVDRLLQHYPQITRQHAAVSDLAEGMGYE